MMESFALGASLATVAAVPLVSALATLAQPTTTPAEAASAWMQEHAVPSVGLNFGAYSQVQQLRLWCDSARLANATGVEASQRQSTMGTSLHKADASCGAPVRIGSARTKRKLSDSFDIATTTPSFDETSAPQKRCKALKRARSCQATAAVTNSRVGVDMVNAPPLSRLACGHDGCNKSFSLKSSLKKHMRSVHLRERSHVCDYDGCGKAFSQQGHLTTHVKGVHLRERNHVCDYDGCGKAFSCNSHLTTHVKGVHLRERSHVCDYDGCGKAFSVKSHLTKHVATVHLTAHMAKAAAARPSA